MRAQVSPELDDTVTTVLSCVPSNIEQISSPHVAVSCSTLKIYLGATVCVVAMAEIRFVESDGARDDISSKTPYGM